MFCAQGASSGCVAFILAVRYFARCVTVVALAHTLLCSALPLLPLWSPSGSPSPTLVYTGLATSDRATALLLLLPHRIKVVVQQVMSQ